MTGCTLRPDELAGRLGAWQGLLAQATSHTETQFRFPPHPALAARLAELAAAETQCCGFFRFDLTITASELTLLIDASPPR